MHLDAKNPCRCYMFGNYALPVVTACKGLSVLRTVDDSCYSSHVANIMQKARRLLGTSIRAKSSHNTTFILNVLLASIKPTLNYTSQIENQHMQLVTSLLLSLRNLHFTKRMVKVKNMSYNDRL